MVKREEKFLALIIPRKDADEFFKNNQRLRGYVAEVSTAYSQFRREKGKKPYNKYIIVNQDEPYADEVWKAILVGESHKFL